MDKFEVLQKYFSKEVTTFRGHQEEAINSIISGNNVLCLMPTGEGKSLIYQVAGLCLEKTTIVISPLIALMKQQTHYLRQKGFCCLFMSELDVTKQFKEITNMASGHFPSFIFISPERASSDGYLEFVLNQFKDQVGLVVIDEAHCISQWGDGFRPAYKTIPEFIDRVFGPNSWPRTLCLTATLNANDKQQVIQDFKISKTFISKNLWRKNLSLEFMNLGSGKDDSKDEALQKILLDHVGEKILVFVHRKYGNKGTTRTLFEKYSQQFSDCAFFDADISDIEKDRILYGFQSGEVKIVFATSAFGMGVDIPDIRVVVHYLISESVEQYYQEVGRAGRDGKPAFGYLFYTNQSRRGRMRLIESSLCNEKDIFDEYTDRIIKSGDQFGSIKFEELTEERKTAFALLIEYGVIEILSKGVQSIKCFKARNDKGKEFIEQSNKISATGLTKILCKKQKLSINDLTNRIWRACSLGELVLSSSPSKALFYRIKNELGETILKNITDDQNAKKEERTASFSIFANAIENGSTVKDLVIAALNIEENIQKNGT